MATAGRDLRYRPATEDDLLEIVTLIQHCMGAAYPPWSPAFWDWKHRKSPFGPSPCMLAVVGDRVVGLRVFSKWQWVSGSNVVQAVRAVDTVTASDWRGRGIFSKLTLALVERVREEGTAFVYNTPNQFSRPGYLKMGWQRVGRLPVLVRPSRPAALAGRMFGRAVGRAAHRSTHETAEGGQPVEALCASPDLAAIVAGAQVNDQRLHTQRSADYLAWRFRDIPGMDYRVVWSVADGSGVAIVYRVGARDGLRELRICELIAAPNRSSMRVGRGLVGDICRNEHPHYTIAMAAHRTAERDILRRSGFIAVPRVGPELTVRPLVAPLSADPLRWASWRCSIGDMELF